jgi:hypothetical protein
MLTMAMDPKKIIGKKIMTLGVQTQTNQNRKETQNILSTNIYDYSIRKFKINSASSISCFPEQFRFSRPLPIKSKESTQTKALSAASAAKFNITPVRWQHPSHVAIVPPESKGKTEGNDWDTACGNLQT